MRSQEFSRPLAILRRLALLTLVWVVLVEGSASSLTYGLVLVPVAVALSLRWLPLRAGHRSTGGRVRLRATAGLLVWIGVQTVRGGVDVARRALASAVRVDPVHLEVPVHLTGGARAFALGVYGLMPGTIVMAVHDGRALVHSLSSEIDAAGNWTELQRRVAAASGQDDHGSPAGGAAQR